MELLARLKEYRSGPGVFNPWRDTDPAYDIDTGAPAIRLGQLETYLRMRVPHARLILLAEAAGYQGCRFTGIAMTSERILLGHRPDIDPRWALPAGMPRRTSRPDLRLQGFSEPTATVVWGAIRDAGLLSTDVILWNSYPFHPYNPGAGGLTNRTPSRQELEEGAPFVRDLLELCPRANVVAVGQKAAATLAELMVEHQVVRHPANGGAGQFREQLKALLAG